MDTSMGRVKALPLLQVLESGLERLAAGRRARVEKTIRGGHLNQNNVLIDTSGHLRPARAWCISCAREE